MADPLHQPLECSQVAVWTTTSAMSGTCRRNSSSSSLPSWSIDQGGLGAEAKREEDDATGLGAKQLRPTWLLARPLQDDALDLPDRVEVGARGGWTGAQRALHGLEVCLHLIDAGAGPNRLLDALSDRERFL
jgi:hypothetical protein